MHKIFISYSRKDIDFVRKLAGDLEKAEYDVWWDLTDLRGGDDWPRVIPAAIAESQSVIVVLSPNSVVSDWVEKEYTQALSLRRKIIPIMFARSDIPFALNTINYVDFTSHDDYVASFNNLLTALGFTGERPVVVPPMTLPMMLRKYAIPIGIAVLILLAILSTFVFRPPPPETSTPTSTPTTPVVIFTDTATVSPTVSLTVSVTPTITETTTPRSTFTPSATKETFPRLRHCVNSLYASAINVRSGPSTIYAPMGEPLLVGECLYFSARNEEETWLQVASDQVDPAFDQYMGGWIYRELLGLGITGPIDLPAVTLTSTPTPSDTPTITPTFTRTPTLTPSNTPTLTPEDTAPPTPTETTLPTPTETLGPITTPAN